MKKYIKCLISLFLIIILSGCIGLMGPKEKVDKSLKKYVNADSEIVNELNNRLSKQDLTKEEKDRYTKIIINEYKNIKYTITKEEIKDDKAVVSVDIKVLDLYGASKEAEEDLAKDPSKFYTDNEYDFHKFTSHKLTKMENTTEYKEYEIFFNLTKKDEIWNIDELDDETLEKIHGIYNYEDSLK